MDISSGLKTVIPDAQVRIFKTHEIKTIDIKGENNPQS